MVLNANSMAQSKINFGRTNTLNLILPEVSIFKQLAAPYRHIPYIAMHDCVYGHCVIAT